MWIARNKDKRLWCALNKPIRTSKLSFDDTNTELCQWDFFHENAKDYGTDEMALELPISWFPDLTWDDEPVEVNIFTNEFMQGFGDACYERGDQDACRFEYGENQEGNLTIKEYVDSKNKTL